MNLRHLTLQKAIIVATLVLLARPIAADEAADVANSILAALKNKERGRRNKGKVTL